MGALPIRVSVSRHAMPPKRGAGSPYRLWDPPGARGWIESGQLLPALASVVDGKESLDASGDRIWKRSESVAVTAKAWLDWASNFALEQTREYWEGGRRGRVGDRPALAQPRMIFAHPPVRAAYRREPHPALQHFKCVNFAPSPAHGLTVWRQAGSYYVVAVGLDSHGNKVLTRVHQLIAWCLNGMPDATGETGGSQMCTLHKCNNKSCVSGRCLYWGTPSRNALDREDSRRSRMAARRLQRIRAAGGA